MCKVSGRISLCRDHAFEEVAGLVARKVIITSYFPITAYTDNQAMATRRGTDYTPGKGSLAEQASKTKVSHCLAKEKGEVRAILQNTCGVSAAPSISAAEEAPQHPREPDLPAMLLGGGKACCLGFWSYAVDPSYW